MGSGKEWRRDNIRWKKLLGSGSELSGVSVWRAGPFSIHTLELRFKRQIFMIFIVDYIYQKGFLKILKRLTSRTILLRKVNNYVFMTQNWCGGRGPLYYFFFCIFIGFAIPNLVIT